LNDTWIWNRYWHSDRIASCFDDNGLRNYDDRVVADWHAFFGRLPNGTAILDLCTGNGAIAVIAAEIGGRQDKEFDVVAVDQAEIDPQSYVTRHQAALSTIRFRAGVPVESLPFSDKSFGAVVSQYGLEYSDLTRSVPELCRVIAPAGRVRLVMHTAEGTVAQISKRIIADVDFLLDEIDLAGVAQRCFQAVPAVERNRSASADERLLARQSLAAFDAASKRTAERIKTAADPATLCNSAATLIDAYERRGHFEVRQLVAIAERVKIEDQAHRGRLQALVKAAVTRPQRADIAGQLRRAGARRVEESDLMVEGSLIGHVVEAGF